MSQVLKHWPCRTRTLAVLAALLLFTALAPNVAQAETQAPVSAFGGKAQIGAPSPFAPSAAPLAASGPLGALFGWVVDTQQALQRQLTDGVKSLKAGNAMAGAVTLAALSFIYGVVHAVGPGHGKTIISSYVVANEETVRRGVMVSFIAAAMQAMSAIALVSVLVFALKATGLQINAWSNQLESASYALIAMVGLWLLTGQLASLWRGWRSAPQTKLASAAAGHGHDHHDHHAHAHAHDHGHDHAHDHSHDPHAGHHHAEGEACSHVVDPKALAGPVSWRKIVAVVFSVGIRPCTGAIIVLVFAITQGLFWAGVAATFAMAFGTAITVAVLATLALGSRELALKLGGRSGAWANGVWTLCALGGSTLILLFGAILFAASLGPARPF